MMNKIRDYIKLFIIIYKLKKINYFKFLVIIDFYFSFFLNLLLFHI